MIYKLGLLGASGKMGQEVSALLSEGFTVGTDTFELADGITQTGRLQSIDGVELRTFEQDPREPVHAWIDFSRPEATLQLLESTKEPVVICTTGFTSAQKKTVEEFARTRPLLLAPNTSLGIKVLSRLIGEASALADHGFSVVLEEDHHKDKKDSPSGTAKRLLEVLEKAGFGPAQVHVTRAGSIVGNHTVRLIAGGEELSIRHSVTDRRIFARGAVIAAHFLLKQKTPRLYTFDEVV